MLNQSDNELLTRTGPGTPSGEMLRRYWVPALMVEELPYPGCPPVRVELMQEKLVAFRDRDGKVGVVEEFCAHRGASLFLGRNEGAGLRCLYHGWMYDVNGRCIDMPSEPADSNFKDKVSVRSYPTEERGGVIWCYLGPVDSKPEPPDLEWAMVDDSQRFVSKRLQECNYLQALEGGIDSSHVSILHADIFLWNPHRKAGQVGMAFDDTAPRFFIEPTEYGLLIGARRTLADGRYYWRLTPWLMPWYTYIPRDGDQPIGAHAWVPIDDETCWAWSINYHPDRALTKTERDFYNAGGGIHAPAEPGSFRPVQNKSNNYELSRDLQHAGGFSGIRGIAAQDAAVQESMGPIVNRTREHLGSSDAAIIAARRRLLVSARALRDEGVQPPGRDPKSQRVRSASTVLPPEASWMAATEDARRADEGLYVDADTDTATT